MWGPDKLPYGSLGAYANVVLTEHDLTSQQTAQFLIHEIPAKALPTVRNETYAQTAALASTPESPDYFGAVESVAWADKIEVERRKYVTNMGIAGATIGGLAGVAVQAARSSSGASAANTPSSMQYSFQEVVSAASLTFAPILVAGIVGAWAGKKLSPRVMKYEAQRTVKRVEKSSEAFEDEENTVSDVSTMLLPEERGRCTRQPATPAGHLEKIEEVSLYGTASRWANLQGCKDERRYADFITADMSASELNALIVQTKQRLAEALVDSSISRQDPRYVNLLRDLQIVKAITDNRAEAGNTLRKVGRGIGYLGYLGYIGIVFSNLPENTEPSEISSYVEVSVILAAAAFGFAFSGSAGSYVLQGLRDPLARHRSKHRVARELAKSSQTT